MQESSYVLDAKNCLTGIRQPDNLSIEKVCSDFGISQIYYKTVKSYEFEVDRLLNDLEYSVNAGAKVLAWFKKTYSHKEHNWWVRYNCGTKPSVERKTCQKYFERVSRWM